MIRKIFPLLGLAALLCIGMALSSLYAGPGGKKKPIPTLDISITGCIGFYVECPTVTSCNGAVTYTLLGLPAGYSIGDQVHIEGETFNGMSYCQVGNEITINSIAPATCPGGVCSGGGGGIFQ